MRTVVYAHRAAKDLDELQERARNAVEAAVTEYALSGGGHIKSLVDRLGYRLRVGAYRVLFDVAGDTITIRKVTRRTTTTY